MNMSEQELMKALAVIEMRRHEFHRYVLKKLSPILDSLEREERERVEGVISNVIGDLPWELFLTEEEKRSREVRPSADISSLDLTKLEQEFTRVLKEKFPDIAERLKL